ncbi:hypothetical protein ACHAWF_010273 [Thalassiosira exigua]
MAKVSLPIALALVATLFAFFNIRTLSTFPNDAEVDDAPALAAHVVPIEFLAGAGDDLGAPATPSFLSSENETFHLPKREAWGEFRCANGCSATYVRRTQTIEARGRRGGCAPVLEVFEWLSREVDRNAGRLMLAYGSLIHLHREGDLVNKTTGKLLDDDIDLWVSLDTLVLIASSLEPDLFRKFGWSMRFMISDSTFGTHVGLGQLISCCGHTVAEGPNKYKTLGKEPAMETYPIVSMKEGGRDVVKDLWTGILFPKSMVLPGKGTVLNSAGFPRPLPMRIPNGCHDLLRCLYGSWEVPSNVHADSDPTSDTRRRCLPKEGSGF